MEGAICDNEWLMQKGYIGERTEEDRAPKQRFLTIVPRSDGLLRDTRLAKSERPGSQAATR